MQNPGEENGWRPSPGDLVGLRFSSISRVLNMGVFGFGPTVEWTSSVGAESWSNSEYLLHVQCAYRLLSPKRRILLAWRDIRIAARRPDRSEAGDSGEDNDYSVFDRHADEVLHRLANDPQTVISATVDEVKDLRIDFSGGLTLQTFRDSATGKESWRLLCRSGDHLVVPDG